MKSDDLAELRRLYIPDRVSQVDVDYLEFEEARVSDEDLRLILCSIENRVKFPNNPHNSILLYVLGRTDTFCFEKARSDTIDGAPPDCSLT